MKQNYQNCINVCLLLICSLLTQYAIGNVTSYSNFRGNPAPVTKASGSVNAFAGCSGTSTETQDGVPLTLGYNYNFETIGTDVKITCTLLDTKPGLIAYLWKQSPFAEIGQMTNTSGQTFTRTITGQTIGATINYAVKFAFAGGLSVTKSISYVVGDNCVVVTDTQAPTNFTATAGTITSGSVQLLLNGTDDSGALTYTITYGATTLTTSGTSGVQKSYVISNLSPSTAYSFSVTAKDASNNVAANNPIVVGATTLVDTNTMCAGTSSQAQQASFSTGYTYNFQSTGTSVTATFTLLDTDKSGVIAYLWRETPFLESPMTNSSGLTFTKTLTGLTLGASVNFAVKFAYSGGLSVTKYFAYTVGDNCSGVVADTQAPTGFTATAGAITSSSVELLLNGSDDSGAVTYTITYGATTTTVTGNSGVQQSKVIINLTPETAYSFSITAKDAAGNMAANNPIVVGATTLVDTNTMCAGTSSLAAEGSFSTGYSYNFQTTGSSVTATFTLLDTDKSGVVAYLWQQTPYHEYPMTNSSGLTFTKTVTGLTTGAVLNFAVKFAYSGGLSRTKYFSYTVGDNCDGIIGDVEAPANFTASAGAVTSTSVELLLNGTDNSGNVTYTITYGSTTTTVTGSTGVQQSKVINNLMPQTAYSFSIAATDQAGNAAANNAIVVNATTPAHSNTQCFGFSSEALQNTFSSGYSYSFATNGTDVTVTFTLLDTDKTGVIAYLRQQTPFTEALMTNSSGLTFTKTLTGQVPGSTISYAVKFAYSGGLSVTKYFSYTVGNTNCAGTPLTFTTTWDGTAWNNGIPDSDDYTAVIAGDFNSEEDGEITAGSLTVNSGDVVIAAGDNFTIKGALTVNNDEASFTVQDNANLIQSDDIANDGNINVEKESAPMYRLDYAMWASPVEGQTLKGFSPETLDNRFYTYNPISDAYSEVDQPASTQFATGKGYLIRVANTQPAYVSDDIAPESWYGTFTGVPNNGTIGLTVIPAYDAEGTDDDVSGFNAIGNPYPSAINIAAFFEENQNNLANNTPIFFWRKKNEAGTSSYCSLTLAGYNKNSGNSLGDSSDGVFEDPNDSENWVINPGQGFIVRAITNTVSFNNSMRVAVNNGQMFRNAQESSRSRLWLNLSNAEGAFGQTTIAYTPNTTLGLDYGWDGRAMTDGNIAVYSLAGDSKLGIQARPAFDPADEVPLEYKITAAGEYTISLDHMDGVFTDGQDIFLRDNLLGITHNLKLASYGFTSEAGIITGRFDVVYAEALGTTIPEFDNNSLIAYKQGSVINISTGITEMKAVSVYDLRGRLLYRADNINAAATSITTLQAQAQMLIVQVETAKGAKASRKIVF